MTRVEEYVISNKQVFVVRDDLYCQFPGCNNAKARGLFEHLKNIDNEIIGVVDTCVSRAGWCTAWAFQFFSIVSESDTGYVKPVCAEDFQFFSIVSRSMVLKAERKHSRNFQFFSIVSPPPPHSNPHRITTFNFSLLFLQALRRSYSFFD